MTEEYNVKTSNTMLEGYEWGFSDGLKKQWISVKQRKPEPRTEVLAHFSDGTIRTTTSLWDGDFLYEGSYGKVTHWMQLPAAPEETEGGGDA